MLVDEAIIDIEAGNGGNGKASFRREKFVPKGGPDGGDGGNAGSIYVKGTEDITALNKFRFKKEFKAEDGEPGGNRKKSGADGKDLSLVVPIGTVIKDIGTNEIWEIVDTEKEILIAQGGKGGRGNWHFRSATNQAPTEFEYGTYGRKRQLSIELRLIADIGFIGFPSVGKSSLLNELTNAGAKVAAYHFTTLEPNLGVMDKIILADLPGLIEGASEGKGLGIKFLKHIKRTKVLVHCISADSQHPFEDYEDIRKELGDYDSELLSKHELILITKSDLVDPKVIDKVKEKLKKTQREILPVSIHNFDQIEMVKECLKKLV
jgi:GTP-binding protein